ncbi:DNA adenine methylase [Bdellovibrio svalbardensis]|uniref:site-specific DNA-methyltransferase (adenine-specific) n=1 Tax=Bdellovibrio svalbardensis TaxID=2972972 RepID=A0ABT6DE84_9BACT|nr:DNA adenine methylase [Bdellovibrio svalbardensis]MDG0815138.1 DNA adenine methylase [Bdellovibrio svalbardensis]
MEFFSPLRYPGGKAKLSKYMGLVLDTNRLGDADFVEPFAGGASIGLYLLANAYARKLYLNDIDISIYAFWHSILNHPEDFCRKIEKIPVDLKNWREQKEIQRNRYESNLFDLGFSTFFLNRTNRSGIMNGGVIGSLKQDGPWKIDSRFNKVELIRRIERIADFAGRISVHNRDACDFVKEIKPVLSKKSLVYLDPPYLEKGPSLYRKYFDQDDHANMAEFLKESEDLKWVISYDNHSILQKLYKTYERVEFTLSYSAAGNQFGGEVIYFAKSMAVPNISEIGVNGELMI